MAARPFHRGVPAQSVANVGSVNNASIAVAHEVIASVIRFLPALLAVLLTGCGATSATPSRSANPLITASPPAPMPSDAPSSPPAPSSAQSQPGCHAGEPLAGVYHPGRLRVVQPCTTVTGTVVCRRSELDGDSHIRLRVDDQFRDLLTSGNAVQRCAREGDSGPHLVVETIPQHCGGVAQRDAQDNCADNGGFTSPSLPAIGAHVAVTGPLVIDEARGHGQTGSGWAEIHPAEMITAA